MADQGCQQQNGIAAWRMTDLNLSDIGVVLLEAQYNIRSIIKHALMDIGCRNLYECGTPEEARNLVRMMGPELLLADLDAGRQEVCDLVEDIRYRRCGADPFLVVIATTWEPSPGKVRRAIDSGIDDIVTKPISVSILKDRVENQIHNRKNFVATASYLGPDRRHEGEREDDETTVIRVPNNLRYKVTGDAGAVVDDRAVAETMEAITHQKIQRISIEVTGHALQLENLVVSGAAAGRTRIKIDEITRNTDEIARYLSGENRNIPPGLEGIVVSMQRALAGLAAAKKPAARDVEVLRLHAQAINAALLDQDGAGEVVAQALRQVVESPGESSAA